MNWTTLVQGFGLGASLIIAIGAQNAFVLRQGLKRQHVFLTALICALCDIILILLGVAGLGNLLVSWPLLTQIATWGGIIFLFLYGLRKFWGIWRQGGLETDAKQPDAPRARDTIIAVLAFSLLNPHVYLDTVVLIGSIAVHYPANERPIFASGTMLASCVWFFGLAYGATWLTPLFRYPLSWKILDALIGIVMWSIAGSLLLSSLG